MVVLLVSISMVMSSIKSYQSDMTDAGEVRVDRVSEKVQTDIVIDNAWYIENDDNLEVLTRNSGSTPLEISAVHVILDGRIIPEDNIISRKVDNRETNVWISLDNLEIVINCTQKPDRVKVIAGHGISDYFDKVEVVS